jgi:hypothetical protein
MNDVIPKQLNHPNFTSALHSGWRSEHNSRLCDAILVRFHTSISHKSADNDLVSWGIWYIRWFASRILLSSQNHNRISFVNGKNTSVLCLFICFAIGTLSSSLRSFELLLHPEQGYTAFIGFRPRIEVILMPVWDSAQSLFSWNHDWCGSPAECELGVSTLLQGPKQIQVKFIQWIHGLLRKNYSLNSRRSNDFDISSIDVNIQRNFPSFEGYQNLDRFLVRDRNVNPINEVKQFCIAQRYCRRDRDWGLQFMPIESVIHECTIVISFKFLHCRCDGEIKCGYRCAPNWRTSSLRKANDHLSRARCTIRAFPKGRPHHPCKNW